MITPLLRPEALRGAGLLGSSFYKTYDATPSSARTCTGWQDGENSSAVLPAIPYSARAARWQPESPSRPPKLHAGLTVGINVYGDYGVTGAALARVVRVDTDSNTVTVEIESGEEKEVLASDVFDRKLFKLVNGMRATPRSRFDTKERKHKKRKLQLPQMTQQSPRRLSAGDASGSDQELPFSPKASGRRNSAETLGEVSAFLQQASPKVGPPCDAKTFKRALLKKFERLEYAWETMDSNDDGTLGFMEFTRACRHIKFTGNFKKIFLELTRGEDRLRPELLDADLPAKLEQLRSLPWRLGSKSCLGKDPLQTSGPDFNGATLGEVQAAMNRPQARSAPPSNAKTFRSHLLKTFGRLDHAWEEMDTNGDGIVDFVEFTRQCRILQFSGNLKNVFDELTGGDGSNRLRPELLDANLPAQLAIMRSKEGLASPRRNSFQMAKELSCSQYVEASDFEYDQSKHHTHQAETLGEVQLLLQRPEPRIGPPCDASTFKRGLKNRFHSLAEAWRLIDANDDGLLQYHEFVRACRNIQFVGNLKKIFEELTGGEKCLRPELLDPKLPAELAKLQQNTRKPRTFQQGFAID